MRHKIKELSKLSEDRIKIPYELQTYTNGININDLYECVTKKDKRKNLINEGKVQARSFLKYLDNISDHVQIK